MSYEARPPARPGDQSLTVDNGHQEGFTDVVPEQSDAGPGHVACAIPSSVDVYLLGAVTDLLTAARVLGIGRTKAYQLARSGTFPVPVVRVGDRYRVPTAPLLRLLGLDAAPDPKT